MKKAISFAETRVKKSEKIAHFRGKLIHDSQTEKQEHVKIEKEQEIPVEIIHEEKPSLDCSRIRTCDSKSEHARKQSNPARQRSGLSGDSSRVFNL